MLGDQDSCLAEADEVSQSIMIHVSNLSGEGIFTGPTLINTEICEIQDRIGKGAVAFAIGDVGSGDAEADNVGQIVVIHISGETWKTVIARPPLGRTEIAESQFCAGKGAIRIGKGHSGSGIAEANNIRPAIAVHVRQGAVIDVVGRPALVGPEIGNGVYYTAERAIRLAERDERSGLPKPDDIGAPIAIDVRELTVKGIVARPAVGLTEIADDHLGTGKCTRQLSQRNQYARIAETRHDITIAVAIDVRDMARKLILAGPAAGYRIGGANQRRDDAPQLASLPLKFAARFARCEGGMPQIKAPITLRAAHLLVQP